MASLDFYLTIEHPCSYFSERASRNIIPNPEYPMHANIYSQLIQNGFRRSGSGIYRPACKNCTDCHPSRLRIHDFKFTRQYKRCLKRNQDIQLELKPAEYTDEYFQLYERYLNTRHEDGGMSNPQKEDFTRFLYSEWSDTSFLTMRLNDQLVGVAVIDHSSDGLSAVYTFFDPTLAQRSLGKFAILQQIKLCEELKHPYLYLGYWIPECKKMQYKADYQPLECFTPEQGWQEQTLPQK